jgi:hypothetical protein
MLFCCEDTGQDARVVASLGRNRTSRLVWDGTVPSENSTRAQVTILPRVSLFWAG